MIQRMLQIWIAGWVVAIFLPSVIIAFLGLSQEAAPIASGFDKLPWTTWVVADEVGPFAKLSMGALLLAALLLIVRSRATRMPGLFLAGLTSGSLSVLIPIALLPDRFSRGFGIGLTGERFDPVTLPIYLFGGAAAGFVFAIGLRHPMRHSS